MKSEIGNLERGHARWKAASVSGGGKANAARGSVSSSLRRHAPSLCARRGVRKKGPGAHSHGVEVGKPFERGHELTFGFLGGARKALEDFAFQNSSEVKACQGKITVQ